MKKIIFIILILFLSYQISYSFSLEKGNKINQYKESQTITFYDYLYSPKNPKDRNLLKLNRKKDVTYKNKVILKEDGRPLNEHTAETDTEFKILFIAMKIKPRNGCNPLDEAANGTLGCYIDTPEE